MKPGLNPFAIAKPILLANLARNMMKLALLKSLERLVGGCFRVVFTVILGALFILGEGMGLHYRPKLLWPDCAFSGWLESHSQ